MYLLGFDIGSSSVKVSLVDADKGTCKMSAYYPKQEMAIKAVKAGWAEQDPEMWWENLKLALRDIMSVGRVNASDIKAIGISYQMHGLVIVDKDQKVLRPSIIWCDSRAVEIGNTAFKKLGSSKCLGNLLNSPGNFTASKLAWVKKNEPALFKRIHKIMLPGDYIAMRMTGTINTTISGLSEGIFWNFKENKPAKFLLDYYGIPQDVIPDIVPTFSVQGNLSKTAATELGLAPGTPVAYRAGDQPNNAFSLNVLEPGEIAATAGTSGVVYGVSGKVQYDPQSRVNTFAHVNYTTKNKRLGVLLCVNGTGILNSWLKHTVGGGKIDYHLMNSLALKVPVGAEGLCILPFGNGAERMLKNINMGCRIYNLNFNIHNQGHLFRAAQEGIVFAFNYGIDIMKKTGITPKVIRAGKANMFLSPIFRDTLSGLTGATIELYDTDGAQGAAKGAGIGIKYYASSKEAFSTLQKLAVIEPDKKKTEEFADAYRKWDRILKQSLA